METSGKAKEVSKLCLKRNCQSDDLLEMEDVSPKLKSFIKEVLTSSDDFWYSLTNGYVNYESLFANSEDLQKIREAIDILEEVQQVVKEIGLEF